MKRRKQTILSPPQGSLHCNGSLLFMELYWGQALHVEEVQGAWKSECSQFGNIFGSLTVQGIPICEKCKQIAKLGLETSRRKFLLTFGKFIQIWQT